MHRKQRDWDMRTIIWIALPLLAACTHDSLPGDPHAYPQISAAQIAALRADLRLARIARFYSDRNDTLPKHISAGDTALKALFPAEQINAFILMQNMPEGVRVTVDVDGTVFRKGVRQGSPSKTTQVFNTCCGKDPWEGWISAQLQVPFRNDSAAVPFAIIFEARINGVFLLKDSVIIE
jgi:hypothetical protein